MQLIQGVPLYHVPMCLLPSQPTRSKNLSCNGKADRTCYHPCYERVYEHLGCVRERSEIFMMEKKLSTVKVRRFF